MAVHDHSVVVSAPGKVLLAGGYIVLDRKHTGLVFGLSARIHVLAQEIETSEGVHLSEIVVQSPQFLHATWRYGYRLVEDDGGVKVTQLQSGAPVEPNHFVETTLNYVLTYIARADKSRSSHRFRPASLVVLADNDYYSKPKQTSPSSPALETLAQTTSDDPSTVPSASRHDSRTERKSSPRFSHFDTTLRHANKTGLGSSAAIVTSLTAALLSHYLDRSRFDLDSAEGKRILHNLAQVAHCSAQGKIGSGFDVASAVYGSCLYRRFSPSLLGRLPSPSAPGFGKALFHLVHDGDGDGSWDCEIHKAGAGSSLPPGVAIRMCDVDCGTQTVGMVKKVHAWRDAHPERAAQLYAQLQGRVDELARVLREQRAAEQIRGAMGPVRELMRRLGRESGVPIEPESQEAMLDALEKVDGVYGTVVPGAGGYDAAAVVMKDDEETERGVKTFLEKWSKENGIQVRLMDVRGETEGVRREELGEFQEWIG